MYNREKALREALQKNDDESQRWQTYLKENMTAISNMSLFGKRLTVDVMVPVGKKAFMPGHLIHTNEVFVGHYQGYFSKCTNFKATEICELRIKLAEKHLKDLETEAVLLQNKLVKPYTDGALPSGGEREIIEEFNEETEELWNQKHRISVRLAKQKERGERISQQKESSNKKETSNEILQMLEVAELMEELEQEFNTLEVDEVSEETIRKIMSGEMKVPQEKKRISSAKSTALKINSDETSLLSNIVKKNDIKEIDQIHTNNNVQPNPVIMNFVDTQSQDVEEVDDETLPKEVILIKEQAKFLNVGDQIGFYDYQIQIVKQKLQLLPLRTQKELDEKIHLLNILDHLEELLEEAEEIVGTEELFAKVQDEEVENSEKDFTRELIGINESDHENKSNKKSRISFALEDKTLEFKKHETVAQMLSTKPVEPQRDVIKLDNSAQEENCEHKSNHSSNKQDIIQAKVQTNLEFVAENQSKQDFDLIQQILQSSTGEINTLHIRFKHSQQEGYRIDNKESFHIPKNPADIYNVYLKSQNFTEFSTLFVNSYPGEDQVKVPVLKETHRQDSFANPKSEYSNPFQAKSILKNKAAVENEIHYDGAEKESNKYRKSKKKTKKEEDDCLSAYDKVMSDVVEKHLTEPEPLPDVKFIDTHTPKKRVSRFKQMRQEKEKT